MLRRLFSLIALLSLLVCLATLVVQLPGRTLHRKLGPHNAATLATYLYGHWIQYGSLHDPTGRSVSSLATFSHLSVGDVLENADDKQLGLPLIIGFRWGHWKNPITPCTYLIITVEPLGVVTLSSIAPILWLILRLPASNGHGLGLLIALLLVMLVFTLLMLTDPVMDHIGNRAQFLTRVLMIWSFIAILPLLARLIREFIYEGRIDSGCCVRCGYNLTGNTSGLCPECGTGIAKGQRP